MQKPFEHYLQESVARPIVAQLPPVARNTVCDAKHGIPKCCIVLRSNVLIHRCKSAALAALLRVVSFLFEIVVANQLPCPSVGPG